MKQHPEKRGYVRPEDTATFPQKRFRHAGHDAFLRKRLRHTGNDAFPRKRLRHAGHDAFLMNGHCEYGNVRLG
jgi:hypothetical protein